jgi:hypothetical protein
VTLLVVAALGPTVSNNILSYDEPTYLAEARLIDTAERFVFAYHYHDETKSPVGLIPYVIADIVDLHLAEMLLHAFGLIAFGISCCILIRLSRRTVGSPTPGVAASVVWLLFTIVGPDASFGIQRARFEFLSSLLERFQTPFVLLGLLLFVETLEAYASARARRLAGAVGVLWALSMLIKPSVALLAPIFVLGLAWSNRKLGWRGLVSVVALVAGMLLPVVAFFLPYLFDRAAFEDLWFNLIVVNLTYAENNGPIAARVIYFVTGFPIILLLLTVLSPAIVTLSSLPKRSPVAFCAVGLPILAGLAVFASSLPGHAFLHYLVPVVPLLGLGAISAVYLALKGIANRGHRLRALALGAALCLGYLIPLASSVREYFATVQNDVWAASDASRFDLDGLVTYIKQHTDASATIWVYDLTPELYVLTERRPATREPDASYLISYWHEPWFQRTADDLAHDRPELIIGIDKPIFTSQKATALTSIPRVKDLIAETYDCDHSMIRGALICTRKARTDDGTSR